MIARVSIISLLLASSLVMAMENQSDYESIYLESVDETESLLSTKCISSLASWEAFAKEHESLEGYDILPQAMAAAQQKYLIKSDLGVLPEVVAVWKRHQEYPEYNQEVMRMHALLRNGYADEQNQDKAELRALQYLCLKKACEQIEATKNGSQEIQTRIIGMRKLTIGLYVAAVVVFIGFILELKFLPNH